MLVKYIYNELDKLRGYVS